jgi:N-acetylmuramoyl-L-alanine amidase
MPSVLIETGFVSNPNEEKFLLSDQGQDYIASAIYRAFKQYKIEMEGPEVSSPKEDKAVEPKKDEDKPSSTEAKGAKTFARSKGR